MQNYTDKLKKYFWFTKEETIQYLLMIAALTIIYIWPSEGTLIYIEDLPKILFFAAITIFVHHAGQRLAACHIGYKPENKIWWMGALAGIMLTIATGGKLKILALSATTLQFMPAHALGKFRYGPNLSTIAKITLAGPIANLIFAGIIKSTELLGTQMSTELFTLNLAFAAWNILPIPPLDGSKIFYQSRIFYVFVLAAILTYVMLAILANIQSIISPIIVGIITAAIYFYNFEK